MLEVYQILISSPGDLREERQFAREKIIEYSKIAEMTNKVILKPYSWENDAYGGIGKDPQEILNDKIPKDYDIYLGMMWKRIGTKTERAASGTAEEFEAAFKRYQEDKSSVSIRFYFKEIDPDDKSVDSEQLEGVKNFRATIQDKGIWPWRDFKDIDDFKVNIGAHIFEAFHELYSRRENKSLTQESIPEKSKDKREELWAKIQSEAVSFADKLKATGELIGMRNDLFRTADQQLGKIFNSDQNPQLKVNILNSFLTTVATKNQLATSNILESFKTSTISYLDFTNLWIKLYFLLDIEGFILSEQEKLSSLQSMERPLAFINKFREVTMSSLESNQDFVPQIQNVKKHPGLKSLKVNFRDFEKIIHESINLDTKMLRSISYWEKASLDLINTFKTLFPLNK